MPARNCFLNNVKRIIIAATVFLAVACDFLPHQLTVYYSLSGTVREADSGAPCVDVTVSVTNRGVTTSTSPDGSFLIPKIASGTLDITLESKEFHAISETVELDGDVTLSLTMAPVRNHVIPVERLLDFRDSLTALNLSVVNAWWKEGDDRWQDSDNDKLDVLLTSAQTGDPSPWKITWNCPWVKVEPASGETSLKDVVSVEVDRDKFGLGTFQTVLRFEAAESSADVTVVVGQQDYCKPVLEAPRISEIRGRKAFAYCEILNMGNVETKTVLLLLDGYGFQYSEDPGFAAPVSDCHSIYAESYLSSTHMRAYLTLEPEKTYYCRAYGTNSRGRSYSEAVSFSTPAITLPEVSAVEITKITGQWVEVQAEILSDGNADIDAFGFCYAVYANPSRDDWRVNTGTYARLRNLTPNSIYYVRAYAENEAGIAYGPVSEFRTNGIIVPE